MDPKERLMHEYRSQRIGRREFIRRCLALGLSASGALALAARCGPQPQPTPMTVESTIPPPPTATPAPTATPVPTEPALISEVVVNTAAEKESADPLLVYQIDGGSIDRNSFDYLLERDWQGNVVPGLAESFEPLDETTLEFRLRRGVSFHNGEPFNGQAVQFSFERMLDPEVGSAWAQNVAVLDSVEVVDEFTVRLHLKEPSAPLLDALVSAPAMQPPGYIQAQGYQAFLSQPVGTGPYRFVEWVKDDHFTLERNPDYWAGSPKGSPFAERVTFRPVPEASTRIANLNTGAAQIIRDVPPDLIPTVSGPGVGTIHVDVPRVAFFQIAADKEVLGDARVRQALNYAVDVEAVIEGLLGGRGNRLATVFAPQTLGFDAGVQPYPYDPDRARSLLREAGVAEGFQVTMDYATLERKDVVEAYAAQLGEVGLDVQLQGFELAVFNDNWVRKNTADLRFATWGPIFDPWSILDFVIAPGGLLSRYGNQQAGELINQGRTELDRQARAQIYNQLMAVLNEDPACIYLHNLTAIYGVSQGVAQFQPRPDEYILLTR